MSAFTDVPARRVRIREGDPARLMSRLIDAGTGTYLTNAMMSGGSFTWQLFDLLAVNPRGYVNNGTLTPIATYLFDSLVTNDPLWTQDETGYNFLWTAPGTLFLLTSDLADTGGDGEFRMEIVATPGSGPAFIAGAFQISVAEMLTYS
jgi:hypothetical protein